MPQLSNVSGVATSIRTDADGTHIRYHSTDVVSFTNETITLRTGGWRTVTTKARMNQASNQFALGFSVYQSKGIWYVRILSGGAQHRLTFDGSILTFTR